jgi:hypothetical protein
MTGGFTFQDAFSLHFRPDTCHNEAYPDAPHFEVLRHVGTRQERLIADGEVYSRSPGDRRAWLALARSTAVALV